mmetsp:Transcript_12844/g.34156  ORF Transcript_12844/g.34156 Transcript_12844/m.34156 type:complete len:264 (-) Transcript_12844:689-1480(-)
MQRNNRRPPSAGEPYHAHHHPGAAQPAPPSEPATVLMGAAAGGHARVQHPPAHMAAPTPAGHAHEYPLPRGAPHAAATTAQPPRAPKDISSGTAAAAVSAAAASTNVWQKHAPAHQPAATQAQAAPKPGPPAAAMFGSFDEETLEKLTRQAGPAPQLQQQQQQPHPSRMLDDRSQMWRPAEGMTPTLLMHTHPGQPNRQQQQQQQLHPTGTPGARQHWRDEWRCKQWEWGVCWQPCPSSAGQAPPPHHGLVSAAAGVCAPGRG